MKPWFRTLEIADGEAAIRARLDFMLRIFAKGMEEFKEKPLQSRLFDVLMGTKGDDAGMGDNRIPGAVSRAIDPVTRPEDAMLAFRCYLEVLVNRIGTFIDTAVPVENFYPTKDQPSYVKGGVRPAITYMFLNGDETRYNPAEDGTESVEVLDGVSVDIIFGEDSRLSKTRLLQTLLAHSLREDLGILTTDLDHFEIPNDAFSFVEYVAANVKLVAEDARAGLGPISEYRVSGENFEKLSKSLKELISGERELQSFVWGVPSPQKDKATFLHWLTSVPAENIKVQTHFTEIPPTMSDKVKSALKATLGDGSYFPKGVNTCIINSALDQIEYPAKVLGQMWETLMAQGRRR